MNYETVGPVHFILYLSLIVCSLLQLSQSLNELNFSFNKMNQLEPVIGKLKKLVFLDLRYVWMSVCLSGCHYFFYLRRDSFKQTL